MSFPARWAGTLSENAALDFLAARAEQKWPFEQFRKARRRSLAAVVTQNNLDRLRQVEDIANDFALRIGTV
jgi:hypothetical protein